MTHSRRWLLLVRWAVLPIAFVVTGSAALCHANVAWTSGVLSITAAMVPLAAVCALFGDRRRRAFRGGFAILGGGYFLLIWLGYPTAGNYGGLSAFVNKMATSKALFLLHDRLFPSSSLKLVPDGMPAAGVGGGGFLGGGLGGGGGGAFQMPADPFADAPAPNATAGTTVSGNPPNIMEDYQTAENFLIIGQCLCAWILGWLGGLFAQFLALRQVRAIEGQKVSSSAASPLKSV